MIFVYNGLSSGTGARAGYKLSSLKYINVIVNIWNILSYFLIKDWYKSY